MPNIREFEAPALELRPTEVGVEATAAAARRGGAFFNQAAQALTTTGERVGSAIRAGGDAYVQYEDHREISAGAAHGTQLIEGMTNAWNQTARGADPNDPSVAPRFREETLEPALERFRNGFTTQRSQQWAEHFIDQYRTHMLNHTTADMASMAGHAVATNFRQTTNSLSNTVRGDPASLDFSLSTLESSVDGVIASSPNLTGANAGRVRNELLQSGREAIVKSAIMGAIERNPDAGIRLSQDPRYSPFITGAEVQQFASYARTNQRLAQAEQRNATAQQEHQQRADFHRQFNALEQSTLPQSVGEQPTLPPDYWDRVRELNRHPGAALEPGRMQAAIHNGEAITARMNRPEPLGPVSHETTMDLIHRMRTADETRLTDDRPIYDAFEAGNLNRTDFNFLRTEFAQMRSPEGDALSRERGEFFKRHEVTIDGGLLAGSRSAVGQQNMYRAEMDARRREADLRRQGVNPHELYNPDSPHYFGKPENIARFRYSMQDATRAMAGGTAPPAPARQPAQPKSITTGTGETGQLAPDGHYYVERGGHYFRVDR